MQDFSIYLFLNSVRSPLFLTRITWQRCEASQEPELTKTRRERPYR